MKRKLLNTLRLTVEAGEHLERLDKAMTDHCSWGHFHQTPQSSPNCGLVQTSPLASRRQLEAQPPEPLGRRETLLTLLALENSLQ